MSELHQSGEYMTATEARKELGISKALLARWIKDGTLPTIESPYHKRMKLIRRADVERLATVPRVTRKELPAA